MNVEKVNLNHNIPGGAVNKSTQPSNLYNTNFTGKYQIDDIQKELMKYMPKKIKGMLFLKKHIGEVQNIIINSIGTGLIAPIFIKWNPLSNTDEDTRTYSAWRQPVSAALAILTQVGATIPFNNKVNSMANLGKLGQDYNMTPYMDEKYLRKLVKRQHPYYTKPQVDEQVNIMRKEQHEELLKDLKTKNTVMFIEEGKPNKVPMNPQRFHETLEATIENLIAEEKIEKKANSETKHDLRIQRSEYYRNNAAKTNKHLDELDEIFKSGDIAKVKTSLADKISQMKAQGQDRELIKFTQEIYKLGNRSTDNGVIKSMIDKVGRARGYVKAYSAMTSREEVVARVENSIKKRGTEIENTLKFFDKVKQAIAENKTVYEIENMFTKELKKNNRLQEKSIQFSEKVADQLLKQTKACIKGYKQVGGIVVSLLTLFVSCPLLNYIYPRFMAAVFPNLTNGKHKKDATSLIERASNPELKSPKAEVK